jgi:hypothetical protein
MTRERRGGNSKSSNNGNVELLTASSSQTSLYTTDEIAPSFATVRSTFDVARGYLVDVNLNKFVQIPLLSVIGA